MTAARLWRMECGYGKGDLVSFRSNRTTRKGGRSMSFVRQFDSDINPMILDVSKYNLGRYGRRWLLYLKEHHPDVYPTMIFQRTLGRHLEEINAEYNDRIYDVTEQLARQEGVDEALKARNQLLWIQRMNSLRQQTEEIVMEDVLYSL